MRRKTRLALAIGAALLMIAGGYTGFWYIAAGQIADGIVAWAQSSGADKIDVSWQQLRVTGFPIAFRVELDTIDLRDNALTPSPEFRIPALSGTARPWNFADWRLLASAGFTADIAVTSDAVRSKVTVRSADGAVTMVPDRGWKLWLHTQDGTLEAISRVLVGSANAWLVTSPKPADQQQTEPELALSVDARQLTLPVAIGPLGQAIQQLEFSARLKGPAPKGHLPEALAAWRDAGGEIELDKLRLKWGGLGASASGTITLDQDLQPVGTFSGGLQGYDEILTVLVQTGQLRATDASLARIALAMVAKPGPDGQPEIRTGFKLQNGQMFLGPARLGKAPRLKWE